MPSRVDVKIDDAIGTAAEFGPMPVSVAEKLIETLRMYNKFNYVITHSGSITSAPDTGFEFDLD